MGSLSFFLLAKSTEVWQHSSCTCVMTTSWLSTLRHIGRTGLGKGRKLRVGLKNYTWGAYKKLEWRRKQVIGYMSAAQGTGLGIGLGSFVGGWGHPGEHRGREAQLSVDTQKLGRERVTRSRHRRRGGSRSQWLRGTISSAAGALRGKDGGLSGLGDMETSAHSRMCTGEGMGAELRGEKSQWPVWTIWKVVVRGQK